MIDGGRFYVWLAYGAAYAILSIYGVRLFTRLVRLRADEPLTKDTSA